MSDLISRKEAIKFCYDLINAENPSDEHDHWNYSQERINQTEVILHHLEFMPSAEPERKTGRWIYGESEVGNDGYYCSECGNFVPWIYEESAMNFIREYKFCPNCGAKMEGGDDHG